MRGRRGSILILALWSLGLFSVLAVSLGYSARQRATLLSRLEARQKLYSIALCGVEKTRAEIIEDTSPDLDALSDSWAEGRRFREISAGGGFYSVYHDVLDPADGKKWVRRYGPQDEASKIDLNKADGAVIARILEIAAGLDDEAAQELAWSIVDWRDQDSNFQHAQHGAEDSEYDDLERSYDCKDGPIESYEELLLVKHMDRLIFDKIRPFVTLWGAGSVNVNTASRQALSAIGVPDGAIDKIMAYRWGADGVEDTDDDAAFSQAAVITQILDRAVPPLDDTERAVIAALVEKDQLGTYSEFFSAQSLAWTAGPGELMIEAVCDRQGKIHYSRTKGVRWANRA